MREKTQGLAPWISERKGGNLREVSERGWDGSVRT